jgi:pimeloyl-ACP methyl ester carboxylesterase
MLRSSSSASRTSPEITVNDDRALSLATDTGSGAQRPFGPVTVAKAYRLFHAILETAVDDQMVRRNPCRIEGAGKEDSPEREVVSLPVVFAIADALPVRYRAMALLAQRLLALDGIPWLPTDVIRTVVRRVAPEVDAVDQDPVDAVALAEVMYPHIEQAAEVCAEEADRFLIEGSGHAPHLRDPVKVNLLLRDFAKSAALGA